MPVVVLLQHSGRKGFVLFQESNVPVALAWTQTPGLPGFPQPCIPW